MAPSISVELPGRASVVRAGCWLAQFDQRDRPCGGGRMDRAHLIDKQRLKKEGHAALCPDPRTWVPACRLHHTAFDNYRGVVVPRSALPAELEELLERIGLGWWLEHRYGAAA